MRAKSGQPIHSSINYSSGDLWATAWHCVPSQPSLGWSPRTRHGNSHSENSTVKEHAKQCHLVHKKRASCQTPVRSLLDSFPRAICFSRYGGMDWKQMASEAKWSWVPSSHRRWKISQLLLERSHLHHLNCQKKKIFSLLFLCCVLSVCGFSSEQKESSKLVSFLC